jgi:hydroxymethylbilane synthase
MIGGSVLRPLRIGTRGSPLALAQAREAGDRLRAAVPDLVQPGAIEIVTIRTTGDRILDRTLAEAGGKGLFTKELDESLLEGRIDLAVHSVKDVPTWLPEGIVLAAFLPREDPRDALVSPLSASIAALPPGAVVGTASLRRQAQILHLRPDLRVVPLRGNVGTRLAKIETGVAHATLLAQAGLNRLGLGHVATATLDPAEFVPAVGQGAIGLTGRRGDGAVASLLAAINHGETARQIEAERAMLAILDGSCRTPIAALARPDSAGLCLDGLVASPDGRRVIAARRRGASADAERMGADLGRELLARAGSDLLATG